MVKQFRMSIKTKGRGFYNVTESINHYLIKAALTEGICSIFLHHTSASIVLCENFDELVKRDLENFFAKLVPDNTKLYEHNSEGKDDMPAHIRTMLTKCDLTLPIVEGKLGLGTWQDVYIWEHRLHSFQRELIITAIGQ